MSLFPEFCLPHGVLSLKVWAPNGAILHSFWFPDQDRWLKCFFLFFSFLSGAKSRASHCQPWPALR